MLNLFLAEYLDTVEPAMSTRKMAWLRHCISTRTHMLFLFNQAVFPELHQVWPVHKSKLLGIVVVELFTSQMPFLSPNQQHQSTEGWQCSWLGTVCCHIVCLHAVKRHPICQNNNMAKYTESEKKVCHKVCVKTSSNTGRFSKFFHQHTLQRIYNKVIIKDPTTP